MVNANDLSISKNNWGYSILSDVFNDMQVDIKGLESKIKDKWKNILLLNEECSYSKNR